MTTQNRNKLLDNQIASVSPLTPSELRREAATNTDAPAAYPKSAEIFSHNRGFIPGGVVSVNRAVQPEIVFVKGQGEHMGRRWESVY